MRRLALAAAPVVAVVALGAVPAGCGSPSADLFEVTRSGADPGANVALVVSDGGSVRCNGVERPLDAERLLRARRLARDLERPASLGLELPRAPGAILSYRARMGAGAIAFSDASRGVPASFEQLAAFTTDVAENVCRIER